MKGCDPKFLKNLPVSIIMTNNCCSHEAEGDPEDHHNDNESDPEHSDNNEEVEYWNIEISDDDKDSVELDFQHCSIPKLENLESLSKIERLGFRWNLSRKLRTSTLCQPFK